MRRRPFAMAALALLAACTADRVSNNSADAPVAQRKAPSGLDMVQLTIQSRNRTRVFAVEVARTPEEQEHGLMDRRSLGPNAGMLFPFDPPRDASFWMHDTLIPLDLIFIRPDGSIARIATGVPLSEEHIEVAEPLTAVLEIAGGRAAALGITTADRVSWTD